MLYNGVLGRVTVPGGAVPPKQMGISAWYRAASMGESDRGSLFDHNDRPNLRFNGTGASNKLKLTTNWTGDDGDWDMATAVTLDTWQHVFCYYDASLAANDPVFYLNGILVSTTQITNPTGSHETSAGTYQLGDNGSGGDTWHGDIGRSALYLGRIITPDDVALIYARGPMASPAALYYFLRMDALIGSLVRDYSGNGRDGTITGAMVGEPSPEPSIPAGATMGL